MDNAETDMNRVTMTIINHRKENDRAGDRTSDFPFSSPSCYRLSCRGSTPSTWPLHYITGALLSRGKPVRMIDQSLDWQAERVVDGNSNRDVENCGCCAATSFKRDPWLELDLQQEYNISSVVVTGRNSLGFNGELVRVLLFIKRWNFRLLQIESICRRQSRFECFFFFFKKTRKHCGKRRKFWLPDWKQLATT